MTVYAVPVQTLPADGDTANFHVKHKIEHLGVCMSHPERKDFALHKERCLHFLSHKQISLPRDGRFSDSTPRHVVGPDPREETVDEGETKNRQCFH